MTDAAVVPAKWVVVCTHDSTWGRKATFLLTKPMEWNYAPMPSEWADSAEILSCGLPVMFFDTQDCAAGMAVLKQLLYSNHRIEVRKWVD